MTIVAGPLCPDEIVDRIRRLADASTGVRVERTVADLCGRMRVAALSVSQCGYNTALDIVCARVPALVVPFADNGDSEQTDRAGRLERLNAVRVFRGRPLTGPDLAAAIRDALPFVPRAAALDVGGGPATARILTRLVAHRDVRETANAS